MPGIARSGRVRIVGHAPRLCAAEKCHLVGRIARPRVCAHAARNRRTGHRRHRGGGTEDGDFTTGGTENTESEEDCGVVEPAFLKVGTGILAGGPFEWMGTGMNACAIHEPEHSPSIPKTLFFPPCLRVSVVNPSESNPKKFCRFLVLDIERGWAKSLVSRSRGNDGNAAPF